MNKRENIVKVLRSIWSSLDSHLDFTCKEDPEPCKTCGDTKFQIRTVKDYAQNLKDLADIL